MHSSSTKNKNKVAPSMSITRSFPRRHEKICGLNSSTEFKHYDELFKKFLKESQEFSTDEIVDTREDQEDGTESTSDESNSSVCTERKLRRIKRKLFLEAAKAPHENAVKGKLNTSKTRNGKE